MARLPVYLRALQEVADAELATISSERLAEMAGVNAAKVRKDLSYFGSYGTRGVGYDVEYLLFHIRRELGLTHDWPCVIVGMGNLWVTEFVLTYDGQPSYSVSVMEFLDGKVARETQYFADPFEPGPSRAAWVERMG